MTVQSKGSPCHECGTEREIYFEGMPKYYELPIWFCPKCQAGCGELTEEERKKYGVERNTSL